MQKITSWYQYGKNLSRTISTFCKNKLFPYIIAHKALSLGALVLLSYGSYKIEQSYVSTNGETHYAIARTTKNDLTTTVTGTGQVSASNQIDLKAKASGAITYIGAHTGDEVTAGTILAKVDTRDIDLSLASARINLQKVTQPADKTTVIQSENALDDAKEAKIKSVTDLEKAYDDALTSVSSTFVDLPEIVNGLNTLLYSTDGFLSDKNRAILTDYASTYRNTAGVQFDIAKNDYNDTSNLYKTVARSRSTSSVETLLENTYHTVSKTGEALKNAKLATDYIKERVTSTYAVDASSAQTNINNWTTKNNTHLSDISSARNQIVTAQNNLDSATRNVREKTESLAKTMLGSNDLDIRSQQISVAQKELEYENYILRAPFDGVLAKMSVKKNDITSSGSSLGVFISKQKVADITLNEVDASKVKIGQPVTITFDAVDGVTATGTVASIDLVGTVTQGVVTYNAQIAFDARDERIKSGMSVSVIITTERKTDVLTVPSSAIKTKGGKSFVQVVKREDVVPESTNTNSSSSFGQNGQTNRGSSTRMRNKNASSSMEIASENQEGSTSSSTLDIASSTFVENKSRWQGNNQQNTSASGFGLLSSVTLLNTPEEREVTVGISNDTLSEIISGLSGGEFVISKTIASTTKAVTSTAPGLFNVGGGNRGSTGARAGGTGR
jgi:HlyD family secretion protein